MSSAPPPVAPLLAEHDALPAGTRFGELEIIRVLGAGGFGIVYLARDHALERHVALKEYMPASLAARGAGPMITVRSGSHAETYAIGLRSFVNEARLLARFDHPSLVKVYRFWEDNATAYMVMPYLQGRTLRDVRRAMSQSPSETWIRNLLGALLSALELLHREGVYHRDIAPDNILLPPDGPPVLLDFGAARRVISDRTQSLTAILKPNYAPIEQYAEMTQLRQGAWTDLYALGAVAHFLLFGQPPPPATARAVRDELASLPQRLVPGISPRLMATVAWMLAVRPQQRPQNVEELRAVLEGRAPVPVLQRPPELPPSDLTLPLPGSTQFPPTLRVDPGAGAAALARPEPGPDDTVIRPAARPVGVPAAELPTPRPPGTVWAIAKRRGIPALVGLAVVTAAIALWLWGAPAGDRVATGSGAGAPPAADLAASAPLADPPVRGDIQAAPPIDPPVAPVMAGAPPDRAAAAASLASPTTTPAAAPAAPFPDAAREATAPPKPRPAVRSTPRPTTAARPTSESPPLARATPPPARPNEPMTPVAAAAAPEAPATAREACGSRVFLALWTCMDRECERPRYRDHPECVKVLEIKRRRGD